jgi:glycosyl hydrolase family 115 (putative glucuronidase)/glycosyl hydrolase family 115
VNLTRAQLLTNTRTYIVTSFLWNILSRLQFVSCCLGLVAICTMQFAIAQTQNAPHPKVDRLISFVRIDSINQFALVNNGHPVPIYVASGNPGTVTVVAQAFAKDLESVSGTVAQVFTSLPATLPDNLVIAGVIGHSKEIDQMRQQGKLHTDAVEGKWESALTTVVMDPIPGVRRALVIAASDRRGAAFALFTLSRQMGVSPWTWWADVPVEHHLWVYVSAGDHLQREPSVKYRGIFLNDEDWGLRPWAAKTMDPEVGNIGTHTYARVFELLLRLNANTLWPAMHPGTLAFNELPQNAVQADRWGIVMGSSHSEALLRNNVGEWDEERDGPWNYQLNHAAIDAYWEKRLVENGRYESFYTVGMRGVHDSGLEATGTVVDKARLVETVMSVQRDLLRKHVDADVQKVPQVIWLYKESLDLYRAGMQVPDDVTLGWTDDNYGYLRQLPTLAEQKRAGGAGVYYHVSYWGAPHDYLWLCTTPPALIREEMTKAYDHNARRYWILNVGDLKPAEADIDYFLQLAWDEPHTAQMDQRSFLDQWAAEQFPRSRGPAIAKVLEQYYRLNFVRKPEFMGFNGYNDRIERTDFNPLAWGDQNRTRTETWQRVSEEAVALARRMPHEYRDAFFELVGYPVEAAAAQNEKFLAIDRSFLDASRCAKDKVRIDSDRARSAYDRIQSLTKHYNAIGSGKWDGMMSATPRDREVFRMPKTAESADSNTPLPISWKGFAGDVVDPPLESDGRRSEFVEQDATISINAAHFTRKLDGQNAAWRILPDLGISGPSVVYGSPGQLANAEQTAPPISRAPWLEYEFDTASRAAATLELALLPTFPVDAKHELRYAMALDGQSPLTVDAGDSRDWQDNAPPNWPVNVLRNFAVTDIPLGSLRPGHHTLRLIYQDPGIIFEHVIITFAGAPPAYPVPPETSRSKGSNYR